MSKGAQAHLPVAVVAAAVVLKVLLELAQFPVVVAAVAVLHLLAVLALAARSTFDIERHHEKLRTH